MHIDESVKAHLSGMDLGVLDASTAPGQPIVQFTRNTGPNQQWEITSLPSSPAPGMAPDRLIKNRLSGLCLDVANNSTAAGAAIVQNPCNVNDPAQRWIVPKLAEIFSPDGGFRHYVNKNSSLAMDVAGGVDRQQRAGHPVPQPRRHHQPAVPAGVRRGVVRRNVPTGRERGVASRRPRSRVSAGRPTP